MLFEVALINSSYVDNFIYFLTLKKWKFLKYDKTNRVVFTKMCEATWVVALERTMIDSIVITNFLFKSRVWSIVTTFGLRSIQKNVSQDTLSR